MRLRHNQLMVNIKILEMSLKAGFSTENKMGIQEIISAFKDFGKYTIRYIVNRKMEMEIEGLCNDITKCVEDFDKMRDTSLVLEMDALRGKAMVLFDKMSSYRAILDSEVVIAEDDISIIRNRLAIRLRDEGECKSMTDADKRARVDPRYERALEDYRVLLRCANLLKYKTPVMNALMQAMTQKISIGRVGMANESYTVNNYEKGKEIIESRRP